MLLKRSQVESMKNEIEKLSPHKIYLSGLSDGRNRGGQDGQARRREMLKVAVADFKRGDTDEALKSIANFNFVLKACDLEDVAYMEKIGSAHGGGGDRFGHPRSSFRA